MQITNNIKIICSNCGKPVPTETPADYEPSTMTVIFKALPCSHCKPPESCITINGVVVDDISMDESEDADTRQMLSIAIRKSYSRELRQVMGK